MKESDLQSKVKREYKDMGGVCYNIMQASETGVPDLIGFIPKLIKPEDVGMTIGVFVASEVKNPNGGGDRRDEQVYQVDKIGRKHGIAGFVESMQDFWNLVQKI